MTQSDWFRKTTWSESDAQDFSLRLSRCRDNSSKAQYLRVQAITLADTGNTQHVRTALELLNRLFSEFPEPFELSLAHLQAAQCHEHLGNTDSALEHFKQSISAQSLCPNRDSGVSLEYPWFVARHSIASHYAAARELLARANVAFPVSAFKSAASRAFIAHEQGDPNAGHHAAEALTASTLTRSQFQNHRELGLVGESFTPFVERLREIAATQLFNQADR